MSKLSREVGEAYRVLENDLPHKEVKPRTTARLIVDYAKQLERAQRRRRQLRKLLRDVELDIKRIKKMLKGLEHG